MRFSESVQTCLSKYKDVSGRASRSEFWWFYLFCVLLAVICVGIDYVIGTFEQGIVSGAFWLVFTPYWSATIRRLHDINWPGTLGYLGYVGMVFITIAGWLMPSAEQASQDDTDSAMFWFAALPVILLFIVLTIVLLIQNIRKGTKGDNRFGPDPLAPQMIG